MATQMPFERRLIKPSDLDLVFVRRALRADPDYLFPDQLKDGKEVDMPP